MKWCNECGATFEEPNTIYEKVPTELGEQVLSTNVCPYCGGDSYEEADYCTCGNVKLKEDIMCETCRKLLKLKFSMFADYLTAEDEAQLDAWLDGNSVADWRSFE